MCLFSLDFMGAKSPHKARICCLYSYRVLLHFSISFIVPEHCSFWMYDTLELRCWRTGERWDSAHPPLQKMRPVFQTRCRSVCLCWFAVHQSCGACTWKKPFLCLEWGHPGQPWCHQCSHHSSPPLPLSHEFVGQGHIQTRDPRAQALDSQFGGILSQCAMPNSLDARILASCAVNPSQLGFTVLKTVRSVQLISALRFHTWCPDWKATQVLQSW